MAECLIEVDGVEMPCPSSYEWSLQDVSASDSGRTDDTLMHKNRKAQKRKIALKWNGKSPTVTSKILKTFNPEYVQVKYWDMMANKYQTRTFYTGDRKAPVKWWFKNNKVVESVSFDIIER